MTDRDEVIDRLYEAHKAAAESIAEFGVPDGEREEAVERALAAYLDLGPDPETETPAPRETTAAMIRADAFKQAVRLVEGIAPDFVDVDVLSAALLAMAEDRAPASICTWDARVVCPVPASVAIDCSTSCPLRAVLAAGNKNVKGAKP